MSRNQRCFNRKYFIAFDGVLQIALYLQYNALLLSSDFKHNYFLIKLLKTAFTGAIVGARYPLSN